MLAFLLATVAPLIAPPPSGIARAGDGDSLTVGGTSVRLFGIDAPEFDQLCTLGGEQWACGKEAADRLSRLVTGRQVNCANLGTDQHGRVLGRCFVGSTEVNRAMVASGYAVAFRHYSQDYVAAEAAAKSAKVGLWAGSFDLPSEVRAGRCSAAEPRRVTRASKRPATAVRSAGEACNIKGNHSRRGEWIYHMPGMPYYSRTRPEAMFCSEAEAQAAGYRRARVR